MRNKMLLVSLFCYLGSVLVGCSGGGNESEITKTVELTDNYETTILSSENKTNITTENIETESEKKETTSEKTTKSENDTGKKYSDAKIKPLKDPVEVWGEEEYIEIKAINGFHLYVPVHPPGMDNYCYGFTDAKNNIIKYYEWHNTDAQHPLEGEYNIFTHFVETIGKQIFVGTQDEFIILTAYAEDEEIKDSELIKHYVLGVADGDYQYTIFIQPTANTWINATYEGSAQEYFDTYWDKICQSSWVE